MDRNYIEPLFGIGPPARCRERLASAVPSHQLDLFAVAWFAHAIAREGLADYLAACEEPCLVALRRGLTLLGRADDADVVDEVHALADPDPVAFAAAERRIEPDLYDLVIEYARAHVAELVPLA